MSVKTNPLRSGANVHRSARLTTTTAHSEDVVNWLHDASQRLFEARLARARERSGPRPTRKPAL